MNDDKLSMRNSEGYMDLTAYEAIKRADAEAAEKAAGELERFKKLLHTIFHVCEIAGFKVVGRIELIDLRTGREWK